MAKKRDYESAPVTVSLGLDDVIRGLAHDLELLRAGKITIDDAIARSMLGKQIFQGVRIYMNAAKILERNAKAITPPEETATGGKFDPK